MNTSMKWDWDTVFERLRTVFPEPQAKTLADVFMLVFPPSRRMTGPPTMSIPEEPDSGGRSDEQPAEENRSDSHF